MHQVDLFQPRHAIGNVLLNALHHRGIALGKVMPVPHRHAVRFNLRVSVLGQQDAAVSKELDKAVDRMHNTAHDGGFFSLYAVIVDLFASL